MGTERIKRSDALEGELVTISGNNGDAHLGYFLNGTVYVVENDRNAVELISSNLSGSNYQRDHGRGFMVWIRNKRKNAVTLYKAHPVNFGTLNDKQLKAFSIMRDNGGIISRKELADRMQLTSQSASKLMNALLEEALVSIDIKTQVAYFSNSADHA